MGSPKTPAPPPAVPPPPPLPPSFSSPQVSAAGASYRANAANAAGLSSTVLTGPAGADASTTYPGKKLTGE